MGEKDLEYLATIILLAVRGGAIKESDIDQAYRTSKGIFERIFNPSNLLKHQSNGLY